MEFYQAVRKSCIYYHSSISISTVKLVRTKMHYEELLNLHVVVALHIQRRI